MWHLYPGTREILDFITADATHLCYSSQNELLLLWEQKKNKKKNSHQKNVGKQQKKKPKTKLHLLYSFNAFSH